MSGFAKDLAERVDGYISLRRSLGYAFQKQAATLRALARYVDAEQLNGPLTRDMALSFIISWQGTANGRAIRHGVVRRFCEYLAIYDARTEALDPRAFPRCRAIPPPRILNDEELGSLMSACQRVSPGYPERGAVLTMLVGLLASTGLRSGEALRLDRTDVDLVTGVLHIRKSKFRKDRLVPVHTDNIGSASHLRTASRCGISSAEGLGVFPQLPWQPVVGGRATNGVRRRLPACRSRQRQGFEAA